MFNIWQTEFRVRGRSTFYRRTVLAAARSKKPISYICLHSLRSGDATIAVAAGILDQSFKKHGRWKSEQAKDGYIKETFFEKLNVSKKSKIGSYVEINFKSLYFFIFEIWSLLLLSNTMHCSIWQILFVWVKRIAYLNLDHQCIHHRYRVVFLHVKEGEDMFLYGWMSFNYDWLSKIVVTTHEKRSYLRTGVTWKRNI